MTHQYISPITCLVSTHPPIYLSSTDLFGHLSAIIRISNNPFIHSSIHSSPISSFIYLPFSHSPTHFSICSSMHSCIHVRMHASNCPSSSHAFVCPSVHPSNHPSIHSIIHPCIHLCIHAPMHSRMCPRMHPYVYRLPFIH